MTAQPELLTVERVAVLQRAELFAEVPSSTLVAVARACEEVRVRPGSVVIERGSSEDWLFVVVEGRLRAHVADVTLRELVAGEAVGELAVLVPGLRSVSVTAVESTLLLKLRKVPFDELLEDHPAIATAVARSLARRLQQNAERDTTPR